MTDRASGAAAELIGLLNRRGRTLATAESLTGGLVSAAITSVPGASAVFLGGVVAYATESKHAVLGVPEAVLAQHGPVAAPTAAAMARAACARFGADVGIATTGVAGPDPVAGLAPGTVFVAAALGPGEVRVAQPRCVGDRAVVRACAVRSALTTGLALLGIGDADRE
jgi:nicotinamide-nucleotide amidase